MRPALTLTAALAADAITKYAARAAGIARANSGASFALLADSPELAFCLSAAAVVLCGALVFVRRARLGASLMLAGAVSNLLDRVFLGAVTDWIPLDFIGLSVNLADLWLCLGGALAAGGIAGGDRGP